MNGDVETIELQNGPFDIRIISAWMHWPHDRVMREEALDTAAAEYVATPIKIALEMCPPRFFAVPRIEASTHGLRAGYRLRETIRPVSTGKRKTRNAIDKEACKIGAPEIAVKTFRTTYWPRYRPVSHLWAAAIDLAWSDSNMFPCSIENLGLFFSLAEGYREDGEKCQSEKKNGTILQVGECLRLPAHLR